MKYQVGEIVEVRSMIGRYTGWRENIIVNVYPEGRFSKIYGIRWNYRLDSGRGTAESHMRRKSDDNNASDDSFEEMLTKLKTREEV